MSGFWFLRPMKQLATQSRFGLFSVLLAAFLIVTPVTFSLVGCASINREQASFKTLYAVGTTANTAVDSWLRHYLLDSYQISKQDNTNKLEMLTKLREQDKKVQDTYVKFQAAYGLAVSAAQLNLTNPAPTNVAQICADLVATVAQMTRE